MTDPKPLSEAEIEAARGLCEAVAEWTAPWRYRVNETTPSMRLASSFIDADNDTVIGAWWDDDGDAEGGLCVDDEIAAFVVGAREVLPRALATIAARDAEIGRLQAETLCLGCCTFVSAVDEDGCCINCGADVVIVSESTSDAIEALAAGVIRETMAAGQAIADRDAAIERAEKAEAGLRDAPSPTVVLTTKYTVALVQRNRSRERVTTLESLLRRASSLLSGGLPDLIHWADCDVYLSSPKARCSCDGPSIVADIGAALAPPAVDSEAKL